MIWIFGPLFLLWTVGIVITYFIAQHIANSPYDRTLRYHLDLLPLVFCCKAGRIRATIIVELDPHERRFFCRGRQAARPVGDRRWNPGGRPDRRDARVARASHPESGS
ncbi:two-component system histidine kinase, partial [Alcaligenes faecalis subsp. faecalis NCIB 8687]